MVFPSGSSSWRLSSRFLWICVECVIKLLRLECVAWISVESPSLDRALIGFRARVGELLLLGLHLRWVLVSRVYYPSIDFVYLHDLDLLVRIGWNLRSVCLRDIYSSYPILYSEYCLAWGLSAELSCCCLTYIDFGYWRQFHPIKLLLLLCWAA